jgi:hypothetical protein
MVSRSGQGRDNIAEAGEGKVDLLSLFQILPLDSTLPDFLTAC